VKTYSFRVDEDGVARSLTEPVEAGPFGENLSVGMVCTCTDDQGNEILVRILEIEDRIQTPTAQPSEISNYVWIHTEVIA
jgi:hypothetical protein